MRFFFFLFFLLFFFLIVHATEINGWLYPIFDLLYFHYCFHVGVKFNSHQRIIYSKKFRHTGHIEARFLAWQNSPCNIFQCFIVQCQYKNKKTAFFGCTFSNKFHLQNDRFCHVGLHDGSPMIPASLVQSIQVNVVCRTQDTSVYRTTQTMCCIQCFYFDILKI